LDQLERAPQHGTVAHAIGEPAAVLEPERAEAKRQPPAVPPPSLELEQLQEAWQRTILPAVQDKSIPTAAMLGEAHPAQLVGDTLTLEFPPGAGFHRSQAEEPKNAGLLTEALFEITGRRLELAFAVGEHTGEADEDDGPPGEDELYELVKETFQARDVEE
jgi:hypothetical protein